MPEETKVEDILKRQEEGELAKQLYPALMTIARHYLPSHQAENAVQEALRRHWSDLRSGKSINNPKAFVYGTLKNVIKELSREERFQDLDKINEPIDPEENAEQKLLREERCKIIWQCLAQLSPRCQRLICLHVADEMTFKQLEQEMNQPDSTLHFQFKKCLKEFARGLRKSGINN